MEVPKSDSHQTFTAEAIDCVDLAELDSEIKQHTEESTGWSLPSDNVVCSEQVSVSLEQGDKEDNSTDQLVSFHNVAESQTVSGQNSDQSDAQDSTLAQSPVPSEKGAACENLDDQGSRNCQ